MLDADEPQPRWRNTLFIPAVATVTSATVLLVQAASRIWSESRLDAQTRGENASKPIGDENTPPQDFNTKWTRYVQSGGGPIVFSFKIARLLGCLVLFSLSLTTLVAGKEVHEHNGVSAANIPEITISVAFVREISLYALAFTLM